MPEELSLSVSSVRSVYPVPAAHLQGRLAEMLFWDAIYYLLAVRGETNPYGHRFVETSYAEMQTLADLSRKTLRKQIDEAAQLDEPARLWQDEGIRPHSFVLKLRQYGKRLDSSKIILKPVSYMENGWAWALAQPYPGVTTKSRLPLAVMNVLFRRPGGQTAHFREIVHRCRHKKKPPDAAEVERAILHLIELGLVTKVESRHYRLARKRFTADARQVWNQIQSQEAVTDIAHLLEWANRIDPNRAVIAEEIARLGQFDFQQHYKEIFFDLASVRHALELDWLRYVVKRKRGYQLTSKQRWQTIWKSYERKLRRERFGSESEKVHFNLAQDNRHEVVLSLKQHDPVLLRWGKLVIWVNDSRYQFCRLRRPETVRVALEREGTLVCQRQLCYEDEVVRRDLTHDLRSTRNPHYRLLVETERPLRQFTIAARLEAEYLAQREV